MSDDWKRFERVNADDVRGEVTEELQFHLEMRVADLVRGGLSREAAERAAAEELGNRAALQNRCEREAERTHRRRRIQDVVALAWRDLVQSARTMVRRPGFAATACV